MSAQEWVTLALQASIILTVISFALTARPSDAGFLLRQPGLLLRTVLAMNVTMPLIAILISIAAKLPIVVGLALLALSVSPVPPIVQKKQVASGGRTEYVLALMVTMSILSIALVPLTVAIFNRVFDGHGDVSAATIARIVGVTVLAPVVVGLVIRALVPASERAARGVGLVAGIMLAVAIIPLVIKLWPKIASYVHDGIVLMMVLMAVLGLVIGHLLGGPHDDDREVLATSTASRHPAVAIAVASAFPLAQHGEEVAVVLLYVIVAFVLTAIYQKWQARRIAARVTAG